MFFSLFLSLFYTMHLRISLYLLFFLILLNYFIGLYSCLLFLSFSFVVFIIKHLYKKKIPMEELVFFWNFQFYFNFSANFSNTGKNTPPHKFPIVITSNAGTKIIHIGNTVFTTYDNKTCNTK